MVYSLCPMTMPYEWLLYFLLFLTFLITLENFNLSPHLVYCKLVAMIRTKKCTVGGFRFSSVRGRYKIACSRNIQNRRVYLKLPDLSFPFVSYCSSFPFAISLFTVVSFKWAWDVLDVACWDMISFLFDE